MNKKCKTNTENIYILNLPKLCDNRFFSFWRAPPFFSRIVTPVMIWNKRQNDKYPFQLIKLLGITKTIHKLTVQFSREWKDTCKCCFFVSSFLSLRDSSIHSSHQFHSFACSFVCWFVSIKNTTKTNRDKRSAFALMNINKF